MRPPTPLFCTSVQSHATQKAKIDAIYRKFLRRMINNGFKRKDPENGDFGFVISNQKRYSITRSIPLEDFIEK